MKTESLPQTDSIQELAQFWDTHDFEDELEEVTESVFERRTVIALGLESEEAEAVKETRAVERRCGCGTHSGMGA